MSLAVRIFKLAALILGVLLLTVYFVRAYDSRNMPPLGPEYRIEFDREFDASQETDVDWTAYLEIEAELAREVDEKIHDIDRPGSPVDRYSTDSLTYPGNYSVNFNRSYQMLASAPRGVAVLFHGLSDSPYSMRSTAEALLGAGYSVVVPRMPGHGFAVGGLLQAEWEDWAAVVRIAVRHAIQLPGGDQRLLLGGYSNGGLMAVDYALRCNDFDDLPCPDGLVLMSPAIAVTPLAAAANLHSVISWISYFEKSKWQTILPEIDPFKFTSFPMRAAWEMYRFSSATHQQLKNAEKVARLPPILTFQSVVDNTVSASATVSNLYAKLPANGSELVVYDVNRNSVVLHLMKNLPGDPVRHFESIAPLKYGVTILGNRTQNGREVRISRLSAGRRKSVVERIDYQWPVGIYSLSHIAVPFRPDDPVYGDGSGTRDNDPRVVFGALAPRGEQGVLRLTPAYFLRTRYNPFFDFQEAYLIEWLGGLAEMSNEN
jgi:alpha-beta hydrolase superfamily lysophospholipase